MRRFVRRVLRRFRSPRTGNGREVCPCEQRVYATVRDCERLGYVAVPSWLTD